MLCHHYIIVYIWVRLITLDNTTMAEGHVYSNSIAHAHIAKHTVTRSNARDDLYVQRARTQLFQSTLTISGANIWNKLSTAIIICNSVADFKGALYIIQILCRRYAFWSYPAGLTIGLYRENAIAIQKESGDSNGGKV